MERSNHGRLIEGIIWLALALVAALVLRRDLQDANDLEIEIGKALAFTAAMMVIPTYGVSLGIGTVISAVLRKSKLGRVMQPVQTAIADRVIEIAFLGVGVWTVGMIGTIDILAGIMALIVLFSHVLINDFGRLPGGNFLAGCATWLVGLQLLFIGGTLLTVYASQPGGGLGIGPVLAMVTPGLRMLVTGAISLAGSVRRVKQGGLAGAVEELSGVDIGRFQELSASLQGDPGAEMRSFVQRLTGVDLEGLAAKPAGPEATAARPETSSRLASLGAELRARIASGDPRQAPTESEMAELARLAEAYRAEGGAAEG